MSYKILIADDESEIRNLLRLYLENENYEVIEAEDGQQAGEFIHTTGDTHLYLNHLEQVQLQLSRTPRPLPVMKLNPDVKDLFDFTYEDFTIEHYDPWPAIKGEVSV